MPEYEVRTIEWLRNDRWERSLWLRSPASEPMARHADYAMAHADCEVYDSHKWAAADFNPFKHGGESLFYQTTMPPGVFCDFLQDRGFDPPAAGPDAVHADWVAWWWALRPKLTPESRAAVREAMNLVRFAEVVELPAALETFFMIQELNWRFVDGGEMAAEAEGGEFVALYRDRAKAEARCAELNAARRSEGVGGWAENFSTDERVGGETLPDTGLHDTNFFEVVGVDFASAGGP